MSALANHETLAEYLARGGKVTACDRSDLAPRMPVPEPQGRRSLSLHPEKAKKPRVQERKAYTPAQEAKAAELLRAGKTQREVCREVGISQWAATQIARANGLGRETRGPRASTTPEQREEVRRRCAEGETQVSVGLDMGLNKKTVSNIVQKRIR